MSMACTSNILSASTVLNRKNTLSNHLTSIGADDMNTKYTVGLLLSDNLDGTLSVQVGLGTRIGSEGELADLVLDAGGLELLLGLANPGDFGVGVDDRGNGMVVHVSVSGLDVLDSSNTFLFSFVGKHGSESDVTNALDALHSGIELVIDDNTALGVNFNTNLVEAETIGIRTTPNRDENNIRIKLDNMSAKKSVKVILLRTSSSLPPLAASVLM